MILRLSSASLMALFAYSTISASLSIKEKLSEITAFKGILNYSTLTLGVSIFNLVIFNFQFSAFHYLKSNFRFKKKKKKSNSM